MTTFQLSAIICRVDDEGGAAPAPPGSPYDITSVTDSGGEALFHTASPHGLSVGDWVYFNVSAYGLGVVQVQTTPSATTFKLGGAGDFPFAGTDTGTWSLGFAITSVTNGYNGLAVINTDDVHRLADHDNVILAFDNDNYVDGTYSVTSFNLTDNTFSCAGLGFDDITDTGGGAKIA